MQNAPELDTDHPQTTATLVNPPAFDAAPTWTITENGSASSTFRLRVAVDGLSARIDAIDGTEDSSFLVEVEGFTGTVRHYGSFAGNYDSTNLTFSFTPPGPRD